MTVTITAPTLDQPIKGWKTPHQTVFCAILPTQINTIARFALDGTVIGLVKYPLKKVASADNKEAFLYCLIVTIPTEGPHILRVDNLDASAPTPTLRESASAKFTFAIDLKMAVVRGSEMIAAHLAAADPHAQYLTQEEASALYRAAGLLTDSDIPSTQATDSEVQNAIANLKSETDPLPQYLSETEAAAQYRKTETPLSDSDIPADIARDSEVTQAVEDLKAQADPFPTYLNQAEGDAQYRKLGQQIPDTDIPSEIARDTEITQAIDSLRGQADPFPTYLNQAEGDAQYRKLGQIPDADIAASIARDTEITQAIDSLRGQADPFPTYLNQGEGDAQYRKIGQIISDADIADTIARDTEITQAINTFKSQSDPLPIYLNQTEGDALYRKVGQQIPESEIASTMARDAEVTQAIADYMKSTTFSVSGPFSFAANEWRTLNLPQEFSLTKAGNPPAWLVAFNFQYTNLSYQQYCCAGIVSFVSWKANSEDNGIRLLVNAHNQTDFYIQAKATSGSAGATRLLQIKPESAFVIGSDGKLMVTVKPLI
jgi:hypothetical protein